MWVAPDLIERPRGAGMHPVVQGEGHLGRRTESGRRRGSCPAALGEGRVSTPWFQEAPGPSPLGRWEDKLGLGDGGRLRGPPCTRWGGLLSQGPGPPGRWILLPLPASQTGPSPMEPSAACRLCLATQLEPGHRGHGPCPSHVPPSAPPLCPLSGPSLWRRNQPVSEEWLLGP